MNVYPATGLLYGNHPHHLDHLATLCALLKIPLVVTEPEIARQATVYYPKLVVRYIGPTALPRELLRSYRVIFSALPRDILDRILLFAEQASGRRVSNIWVPHGNSDKGYRCDMAGGLARERALLVYGQKMVNFFKENRISGGTVIRTGNYRYRFYLAHRTFYADLTKKEVTSKLPKGEKTVLYAPTWEDAEHSSSLKTAWPHLIRTLPDRWNLIVKLHPNQEADVFGTETLLADVKGKKNVLILRAFPPVYALSDMADIYLGDMSSIGYDFLTFRKPMFFLNENGRDPQTDKGLFLYRCGESIDRGDYSTVFRRMAGKPKVLRKTQDAVYDYAFDTPPARGGVIRHPEEAYVWLLPS
ncbi:MAG: CDP-glycerol glycerophosphotransferase family protein [Simkaniaceae bacterium]|nr:CDP-glycerol glycerophosphotransferase family protein [Simkaniaceae bacterium]